MVAASCIEQSKALQYQDNIDRAAAHQSEMLNLAQLESQFLGSISKLFKRKDKPADKAARFQRLAWSKLKPAMKAVKKVAGPNAEQLLGMTNVGNYFRIGKKPGNYDKLAKLMHRFKYR